jgi:integrase
MSVQGVIDKDQVIIYLRKLLARVISQHKLDVNDSLLRENAKKIGEFVKSQKEPRTMKRYGVALFKYLLPFTLKVKKKLTEIDEKDLARFYDMLNLGESTKTLTMVTSVACINYHRLRADIPRLEYRKIKANNPNAKLSYEDKFFVDLKPEEVEAIRNNMSTVEGMLAVELMANSGLRSGEALGIRWGDLVWEKKENVDFVMARIKHRPGEYGAKGKAGERTVPLSPMAVKLLRILLANLGIDDPNDPAIAYQRIIQYAYRTMKEEFDKAVHKAGIRRRDYPITPHKLRHYFAINYLRLGGNPAELMEIMGINMSTLQTYLRLSGRVVKDSYFERFWRKFVRLKDGNLQNGQKT